MLYLYSIEKLSNRKIISFRKLTIKVLPVDSEDNGKRIYSNDFICSYNGSNGTKMAVVRVKMQIGWIPVRIKRFVHYE